MTAVDPDRAIYVRAGALAVRDECVLVTVNSDLDPIYYLLPGGGLSFGEALPEAVRREVLEETGYRVEVHELAFVREYISAKHEYAAYETRHNVECYFRCTIIDDEAEPVATLTDDFQTGIAWIAIAELPGAPIFPKALRHAIPAYRERQHAVYLGDVN